VPIAASWYAVSTAETCRIANNDNKCVAVISCKVEIPVKHKALEHVLMVSWKLDRVPSPADMHGGQVHRFGASNGRRRLDKQYTVHNDSKEQRSSGSFPAFNSYEKGLLTHNTLMCLSFISKT
jgi:hypothetical protein